MTRVAMVVGWGRSGSTLLDRLLGQLPGVVSLGELREFWLRGPLENRRCGCGEPFATCPHWSAIHAELVRQGLDHPAEIRALQRRVDRGWALPLLRGRGARLLGADLAEYRRVLATTYDVIDEVTGADVLVDSSKLASHARIADGITDLDLRFVHVVRDPRGVVHSWGRHTARRDSADDEAMLRYGAAAAALRYRYYNTAAERLADLGRPMLQLRYEDLVTDPRATLERVMGFLDRPVREDDLAFLDGHTAHLDVDHLIDGNPMRFTTGQLEIRTDASWRGGSTPRQRATTRVLTRSLMERYGYPAR